MPTGIFDHTYWRARMVLYGRIRINNEKRPRPNRRNGQHHRHGYIYIFAKGHPRQDAQGYIKLCNLMMESITGEPIPEGMVVHHKNGIRDDDRPDNLELLTPSEHASLHRKK